MKPDRRPADPGRGPDVGTHRCRRRGRADGRRLEDEQFAAEVAVIWLDLPDAVFQGYEGDDQLLGSPRTDDPAPVDLLRREIAASSHSVLPADGHR